MNYGLLVTSPIGPYKNIEITCKALRRCSLLQVLIVM